MSKYGEKWPAYAKQWDRMKINAGSVDDYDRVARRVLANKSRYVAIEQKTGVPWWLVAGLHMRESDMDFGTYLGNGQSLKRRTTIVPKGRGPFRSFEEGAIDALKYDALAGVKDWRLEKALWYAERFNGFGYEKHGKPSPYLWAQTNIQQAGKYVSDGRWSSSAWDKQLGVAPLWATLAKLDPSVKFVRED